MSVQTHEFKVGMTCEGCSGAVDKVLTKNKGKGIDKWDISLENQIVQVTTKLTQEEVLELIKKTGKTVEYLKTF